MSFISPSGQGVCIEPVPPKLITLLAPKEIVLLKEQGYGQHFLLALKRSASSHCLGKKSQFAEGITLWAHHSPASYMSCMHASNPHPHHAGKC